MSYPIKQQAKSTSTGAEKRTETEGHKKRGWKATVPPASQTVRDPGLLERYQRVVLLNRSTYGWHFRPRSYKGWPLVRRALTESDLLAHLTGACWIGCRAPSAGHTERLALDIDVDGVPGRDPTLAQLADRNQRYWQVRGVFGREHVPLVVQTPRGGLRVLYRIPEQPLAGLIDGLEDGLVPDVLRGAGLVVANGELEVFPQRRKIDRLPLGRAMPLLCPDTLTVVADPAVGPHKKDAFDEGRLAHALAVVEAWHAVPLDTLVPHLRGLERVPRPARATGVLRPGRPPRTSDVVVGPAMDPEQHARQQAEAALEGEGPGDEGSGREAIGDDALGGDVPRAEILIGTHKLVAPRTRHEVEWRQGLSMMLEPQGFGAFGLGRQFTNEEFARALAIWLSRNHNTLSREWDDAVAAGGSEAAAVERFTARYLAPDGRDGSCLVDRLARVAHSIKPTRRRVPLLSVAERRLYLSAARGLDGAQRYRAEVWMLSFARLAKRYYLHAERQGVAPEPLQTSDGRWVVRLRIAAKQLESLDYGKGSVAHAAERPSRYLQYLGMLEDAGLARVLGDVVRPNSPRAKGGRGLAQVIEVALPDLRVTVGEVGIDPRELAPRLKVSGLKAFGRDISIDQALHCLALAANPRGIPPGYGRDTIARVRDVASKLAPIGARAYRALPADA